MPEIDILKAIVETQKLKESVDDVFSEAMNASAEDNVLEAFDTQHTESLLQSEVAHLIMQIAHFGFSFNEIVCSVVRDMAENRPELYEEFVAKRVL